MEKQNKKFGLLMAGLAASALSYGAVAHAGDHGSKNHKHKMGKAMEKAGNKMRSGECLAASCATKFGNDCANHVVPGMKTKKACMDAAKKVGKKFKWKTKKG